MDILPIELIQHIYEFDPTYKILYSCVMQELISWNQTIIRPSCVTGKCPNLFRAELAAYSACQYCLTYKAPIW